MVSLMMVSYRALKRKTKESRIARTMWAFVVARVTPIRQVVAVSSFIGA